MTSIGQQLQLWASRNAELVKTLSETDYAPTALEQQDLYLKDLHDESIKVDREIKTASTKRQAEHYDHKKYQESVLKRFSYKAVGKKDKFDAKAAKEECEYFDALQEEHAAQERKRYLDQQIRDAQSAKSDLEQAAKRNRDAQAELDTLYNSIFSGPTPELPQEDQLEHKANVVLEQYRADRAVWEKEDQALKIVGDAERTLQQALQEINSALDYSSWDMWGGGTMSDMMERNELSRAQSLTSTAYMLYSQAQRFSQLPDIPRIDIDQGHIMSDVIFDNIFSDMAQHDRITASKVAMGRGLEHLRMNAENCQNRVNVWRQQMRQEEQLVMDARKELQRVRQQAFEDLTGPSPPPYSDAPY